MKSLSTAFRHIALASVASVCLALPLGSATQADTGTGASGSSTAPAASDGSSSSTEEVHPTGVDANGNRLSDLQLRKNPSLRTYSGNAAGLYPMKRTGDSPDSVIPPDQRTRVNPTTGYPDRAIVYITKDDRHHCSGWMVSADTLVTAGHCLYNRGGKAWYTNLKFFPGANGNVRPYGFATATQLWTDVNYTRSGDTRQDWGVVKLNRRIRTSLAGSDLQWDDGHRPRLPGGQAARSNVDDVGKDRGFAAEQAVLLARYLRRAEWFAHLSEQQHRHRHPHQRSQPVWPVPEEECGDSDNARPLLRHPQHRPLACES